MKQPIFSPKKIHLHAGVHKTASTHIQAMIWASREQLERAGIALEVPMQRPQWIKGFRRYHRSRGWSRRIQGLRIRLAAPGTDLWLNSNENFAGVPGNLLRHKVLFKSFPGHLRQLKRLFPNSELRVFFAIRSYDSFLLSNYLELIRMRGYFPWEQFRDMQRFAGFSWLELLGRITAVMPQEQVIVWRFEDYRPLQSQVISLLTGLDDVRQILACYGAETTRPSLSARAIEELRKRQDCTPQTPQFRALIARIGKRYPVSDEFPRLQPWSEDERALLQQRYAHDVTAIRECFPKLNFLSVA